MIQVKKIDGTYAKSKKIYRKINGEYKEATDIYFNEPLIEYRLKKDISHHLSEVVRNVNSQIKHYESITLQSEDYVPYDDLKILRVAYRVDQAELNKHIELYNLHVLVFSKLYRNSRILQSMHYTSKNNNLPLDDFDVIQVIVKNNDANKKATSYYMLDQVTMNPNCVRAGNIYFITHPKETIDSKITELQDVLSNGDTNYLSNYGSVLKINLKDFKNHLIEEMFHSLDRYKLGLDRVKNIQDYIVSNLDKLTILMDDAFLNEGDVDRTSDEYQNLLNRVNNEGLKITNHYFNETNIEDYDVNNNIYIDRFNQLLPEKYDLRKNIVYALSGIYTMNPADVYNASKTVMSYILNDSNQSLLLKTFSKPIDNHVYANSKVMLFNPEVSIIGDTQDIIQPVTCDVFEFNNQCIEQGVPKYIIDIDHARLGDLDFGESLSIIGDAQDIIEYQETTVFEIPDTVLETTTVKNIVTLKQVDYFEFKEESSFISNIPYISSVVGSQHNELTPSIEIDQQNAQITFTKSANVMDIASDIEITHEPWSLAVQQSSNIMDLSPILEISSDPAIVVYEVLSNSFELTPNLNINSDVISIVDIDHDNEFTLTPEIEIISDQVSLVNVVHANSMDLIPDLQITGDAPELITLSEAHEFTLDPNISITSNPIIQISYKDSNPFILGYETSLTAFHNSIVTVVESSTMNIIIDNVIKVNDENDDTNSTVNELTLSNKPSFIINQTETNIIEIGTTLDISSDPAYSIGFIQAHETILEIGDVVKQDELIDIISTKSYDIITLNPDISIISDPSYNIVHVESSTIELDPTLNITTILTYNIVHVESSTIELDPDISITSKIAQVAVYQESHVMNLDSNIIVETKDSYIVTEVTDNIFELNPNVEIDAYTIMSGSVIMARPWNMEDSTEIQTTDHASIISVVHSNYNDIEPKLDISTHHILNIEPIVQNVENDMTPIIEKYYRNTMTPIAQDQEIQTISEIFNRHISTGIAQDQEILTIGNIYDITEGYNFGIVYDTPLSLALYLSDEDLMLVPADAKQGPREYVSSLIHEPEKVFELKQLSFESNDVYFNHKYVSSLRNSINIYDQEITQLEAFDKQYNLIDYISTFKTDNNVHDQMISIDGFNHYISRISNITVQKRKELVQEAQFTILPDAFEKITYCNTNVVTQKSLDVIIVQEAQFTTLPDAFEEDTYCNTNIVTQDRFNIPTLVTQSITLADSFDSIKYRDINVITQKSLDAIIVQEAQFTTLPDAFEEDTYRNTNVVTQKSLDDQVTLEAQFTTLPDAFEEDTYRNTNVVTQKSLDTQANSTSNTLSISAFNDNYRHVYNTTQKSLDNQAIFDAYVTVNKANDDVEYRDIYISTEKDSGVFESFICHLTANDEYFKDTRVISFKDSGLFDPGITFETQAFDKYNVPLENLEIDDDFDYLPRERTISNVVNIKRGDVFESNTSTDFDNERHINIVNSSTNSIFDNSTTYDMNSHINVVNSNTNSIFDNSTTYDMNHELHGNIDIQYQTFTVNSTSQTVKVNDELEVHSYGVRSSSNQTFSFKQTLEFINYHDVVAIYYPTDNKLNKTVVTLDKVTPIKLNTMMNKTSTVSLKSIGDINTPFAIGILSDTNYKSNYISTFNRVEYPVHENGTYYTNQKIYHSDVAFFKSADILSLQDTNQTLIIDNKHFNLIIQYETEPITLYQ